MLGTPIILAGAIVATLPDTMPPTNSRLPTIIGSLVATLGGVLATWGWGATSSAENRRQLSALERAHALQLQDIGARALEDARRKLLQSIASEIRCNLRALNHEFFATTFPDDNRFLPLPLAESASVRTGVTGGLFSEAKYSSLFQAIEATALDVSFYNAALERSLSDLSAGRLKSNEIIGGLNNPGIRLTLLRRLHDLRRRIEVLGINVENPLGDTRTPYACSVVQSPRLPRWTFFGEEPLDNERKRVWLEWRIYLHNLSALPADLVIEPFPEDDGAPAANYESLDVNPKHFEPGQESEVVVSCTVIHDARARTHLPAARILQADGVYVTGINLILEPLMPAVMARSSTPYSGPAIRAAPPIPRPNVRNTAPSPVPTPPPNWPGL